jgi:cell shape-determining protein MreC
VLLALLLVTSISLITIDYRGGDRSPLNGLRSLAAAVFGPVEQVAAAIASPVSDAVDSVSSLGDGRDEIRRLRRENQELTRRLRTSGLDRNRVTELDSLLRLAGAGRYEVVPAQVIAIGPAQTFSWTVTIDAGSRDGIRPDMTVLNGDGLVGRVKTVGPTTATVLLAVDPCSSWTASRPCSGATGWSPSAPRATRPTSPGCRLARCSVCRARRGRRRGRRSSRRTSTSPRWTWSASSSSRRARTPATPSSRRGRRARRSPR